MNRNPPEPLDAEERALAAQLPPVGGRNEPAPELDAQILAAARAARAGAGSQRRPRRWQMPFALAASLCLAVGLAWQLRQAPSRHARMDGVRPVATAPAAGTAAEAAPAQDSSSAPFPAPAAVQAAPAIQPRAVTEAARPAPTAPPGDAADAAPPPAQPAAEFSPPPPPPAPAPAVVSPATVHAFPADAEATEAAGSERRMLKGTARKGSLPVEPAAVAAPVPKALAPAPAAPARPAAPAVQTAAPAPAAQASRATGGNADRSPAESEDIEDDLPPATMASPAARQAWLQRITELAHAGRLDEARASLAEFRRRYPNEPIPAILHKLEQDAQR